MRNYVGLFLIGVAIAAVGCDAETLARLGVLKETGAQVSPAPDESTQPTPSPSPTATATPAATPDPAKLGTHWSGNYHLSTDSPGNLPYTLTLAPDGTVTYKRGDRTATGDWASNTLYLTIEEPGVCVGPSGGSKYRPTVRLWTLSVFGANLKGTERLQIDECQGVYGYTPPLDQTSVITLVRVP